MSSVADVKWHLIKITAYVRHAQSTLNENDSTARNSASKAELRETCAFKSCRLKPLRQ